MSHMPRRLRTPNAHPGRIVTVRDDNAARSRRWVDARLAADEPEDRPGAILLWLVGALLLLALAAAWWLR